MVLNQTLHGLDLTTPSLLFSATSLILLAYTNRFLSYAGVVRSLKDKYESNPEADTTSLAQIRNFRQRLKLIRLMQILGASSLLFSLIAMFCIYIKWMLLGDITFGFAMILLSASLILCIMEIQISVEALDLHLQTIKDRLKGRDPYQGNSFRRFATQRREGDESSAKRGQESKQQKRKERKPAKQEEARQDNKGATQAQQPKKAEDKPEQRSATDGNTEQSTASDRQHNHRQRPHHRRPNRESREPQEAQQESNAPTPTAEPKPTAEGE